MVIIDDIGSFPLPAEVSREEFERVYLRALEAFAEGERLEEEPALKPFCSAVVASLRAKLEAGLDVVTYPQHYDMHRQFMEPIEKYQQEPYLIQKKYAVIPELYVVEREAERYYEKHGERLRLRVCVTGAIELYLKTPFGFNIYEEVLMNIARSVNSFLKNSLLNTRQVVTEVVSIDEPSLGFVDLLNIDSDGIIRALEESVRGVDAKVQVHLHTLKAAEYPLEARGIHILTGEFASSPENINFVSKRDLESHDKFLRGGVASTSIDRKLGSFIERGIKHPSPEQLADGVDEIRALYLKLREKFGERLLFAGPDCGLGSWPSQEAAQLVLRRCVRAIREAENG
jgi:5-methyltetrahydropteroyltriglutamate--homocysteine methyltransferase